MNALLRTIVMAFIAITMNLGLVNCATPQQSGAVNNTADGYAGYVARVRSTRFVVQGAGHSVYDGSMYDQRTHPAIAQQYAAVRPLVIAGGGGDTSPPTALAQQTRVEGPRVAASDAQLRQVAQTVGEHGSQLRAMNHALTAVQHTVGEIGSNVRALREQRSERHNARARNAPASNPPPTAPAVETEQMTLDDGQVVTITPES